LEIVLRLAHQIDEQVLQGRLGFFPVEIAALEAAIAAYRTRGGIAPVR
jgi:hypothetical protein